MDMEVLEFLKVSANNVLLGFVLALGVDGWLTAIRGKRLKPVAMFTVFVLSVCYVVFVDRYIGVLAFTTVLGIAAGAYRINYEERFIPPSEDS